MREFGQARFAALSVQSRAGDVDLSAGLADDELGVFDLREVTGSGGNAVEKQPSDFDELLALLPAGRVRDAVGEAAAGESTQRAYAVGYFRASSHAAAFGRAVAAALVLEEETAGAGGVAAMQRPFVVFAPLEAAATSHFVAGLRSHPCVASAVEVDASSSGTLELSLLGGARRDLALVDSMGLGLPRRCFRRLLARARLVAVTGDATLNEALSSNALPFLYGAEGHKGSVREALQMIAAARSAGAAANGGGTAAAVRAFWAFAESAPAFREASWAALERTLAGGGGGWQALRVAFAEFSESVIAARGGLAGRICELVHGDGDGGGGGKSL